MQLEDIGQRLREIENRLERLEKRKDANTSMDTARLDWLEAKHAVLLGQHGIWWVKSPDGTGPNGGSPREAIDAAMRIDP